MRTEAPTCSLGELAGIPVTSSQTTAAPSPACRSTNARPVPRASRDQRLLSREHTHAKLLSHDHSTPEIRDVAADQVLVVAALEASRFDAPCAKSPTRVASAPSEIL
jgi:hypothetical protein